MEAGAAQSQVSRQRVDYISETAQYAWKKSETEIQIISEKQANALLFSENSDFQVNNGRIQRQNGSHVVGKTQFGEQLQPFSETQPIPNAITNVTFSAHPSTLVERIDSAMFTATLAGGPLLTGMLLRVMIAINREREMRQEIKFEHQKQEAIAGLKNIQKSEEKLKNERKDAVVKFTASIAAAFVAGGIGGNTGFVASQAVTEGYNMVSKGTPAGFQWNADEAGIDGQEYQWVEKQHQQVASEENDQISASRDHFKAAQDLIRLIYDNLAQQAARLGG